MPTKNDIHKYWHTIINNFDELCIRTIFNTKVLATDPGRRHGTWCAGYIAIITRDGKYIARYPAKNITDDFESVNKKVRQLGDLVLQLRIDAADDKVNKPERAEGYAVVQDEGVNIEAAWRAGIYQWPVTPNQLNNFRYMGENA